MPSSKPPRLEPRKRARQARAEATVEAIVEAAARILSSDGVAALTTNRIAELAGVSVGSVYQYFPNKEAIVVALIDTQLQRDAVLARRITGESVGRQEIDERLRGMIAEICAHQRRLAPLLRQLLPLLSPLNQERLVRERLTAMSGELEAFLSVHCEQLMPELADPQQRALAAQVLTHAIRGVLNGMGLAQPELLDEERFQRELFRLFRGLLRAA